MLREDYMRVGGPRLSAVESPDLGPVVVITDDEKRRVATSTASVGK